MSGETRQAMYEAALQRNLDAELSDAELCPRCAQRRIVPGTRAAKAAGICTTCYLRALADATAAADSELSAQREYDRIRQQRSRDKKARAKK